MRDEIVSSIEQARADLLAWLDGVEASAWTASTACHPWTFKDVLSHMVEGEINVGRLYRAEVGEQGFVDPEEGIERWRALPGVAVRAAFWQHGIATQRALASMTEEAWARPIKAFGCSRVSQLARMHLFDLAVHGHDLTDALGAGSLWAPQLPFLVEYVLRAAPPTFRRRGFTSTGAVRVEVPSLGRAWTLANADGWHLGDGPADATLTIEPEALVLTATGRARGGGDHRTAGDAGLVEQVLSAWRVV